MLSSSSSSPSPLYLTLVCRILVLYCLSLAYKNPRVWPRQRQPTTTRIPLFAFVRFHSCPTIRRLSGPAAPSLLFLALCLSVFARRSRLLHPTVVASPTPVAFRLATTSRMFRLHLPSLASLPPHAVQHLSRSLARSGSRPLFLKNSLRTHLLDHSDSATCSTEPHEKKK